jgi:hypothetical protein
MEQEILGPKWQVNLTLTASYTREKYVLRKAKATAPAFAWLKAGFFVSARAGDLPEMNHDDPNRRSGL